MAFISSDGSIQQYRPWSIARLLDLFWGTISFVSFFFRSMFHLDDPSPRGQYGQAQRGQRAPNMPRRGMGGVGRVSGVAPPPACFGGG